MAGLTTKMYDRDKKVETPASTSTWTELPFPATSKNLPNRLNTPRS
jgi:hypothetical protein